MLDRFVKLYRQNDFGSGTRNTPEFNSFIRKTRNDFRKDLSDIAENIEINRSHFYFSGFLTRKSDGQVIYFHLSDVRFFPGSSILIRTAKDHKDFGGGSNHYVNIDNDFGKNFRETIQKL